MKSQLFVSPYVISPASPLILPNSSVTLREQKKPNLWRSKRTKNHTVLNFIRVKIL